MRRPVCLLLVVFCLSTNAQVLARKGWAGSGVAPEAWWKRAVFYRIQPALFQDSDGDGTGDLNGIAQRLDYIGKLGIDAIVLEQPFSENEFADLGLAASRAHLRVLVELTSPDPARARFWLNQGAAGLVVDYPALGKDPVAALRDLRHTVDSVPGERVLIGPPVYGRPADTPQLIFAVSIASAPGTSVDALRRELLPLRDSSMSPTTNPLIELRGLPAPGPSADGDAAEEIRNRTLAAMAFASRGAVIFDAGRELGLSSGNGKPTLMQWTPANVTRATPPPAAPAPPKPKEELYGAYVPYVPPPKLAMPAPVAPTVVVAENPPPVDPNTLPGFTSGTLPSVAAPNGVTANVALEDRDDGSTLNFFRHLIALHHDSPAIRNGAQFVPEATSPASLLWLRRAPAGTTTSASIVVAANLGPDPATLDLAPGLAQAGIHAGAVRMLLTASAGQATLAAPSPGQFVLPPWTIVLGELQRNASEPTAHSRTHR